MSSFHRSPPMRAVNLRRTLIQKARRYLNWWDSRFSERFFSLTSRTDERVCSPVLCVGLSACVCAPYVKCCVGSVTGQGTSLTYLPRISKYSYVTLAYRESRTYLHARLQQRACADSECRLRHERWLDMERNVRQTRGVRAKVQARSARLPPVKAAGAVVPLCCGILRQKRRINPVVTSG